MVSSTKLVLALCGAAFLAACAAPPQQEEITYIQDSPAAVTADPVFHSKYK